MQLIVGYTYLKLDHKSPSKPSVKTIVEFHPEQVTTLNLCHIINNKFVVKKRGLNKNKSTFGMFVDTPVPHGT